MRWSNATEREIGSTWVLSLFDPALNNDVLIAAITGVEIVAAITRRARGGSISATDATAASSQFRSDLQSEYQVVEITQSIINSAMALAEALGLRIALTRVKLSRSQVKGTRMKKLLFVCSQNRLRSPTAEAVFCEYEGLEVDSAGLDREAEIPLCSEAIEWADIIFVMEKSHRNKLSKKFQPWLKDKRVVCLDIPDEYEYMEPSLVDLLKEKVLPLLGTF